jgi:N-acetylglucosaminyldiphosphoundecaprenol N-acetyl-beta-D-mannosaminyltransferase
LQAQKDEEFKNILNSCDLNIADGAGIKFAFWKQGEKLKSRIAGADLMQEILRIAGDRGSGIFLVANKNGLSTWEETCDAILQRYPNLKIEGVNLDKNISGCGLQTTGCEIVFCNFGAPFQEKFLYSLKQVNYDKIRLVMGVGGSFDYLTGKMKRAPKWMRKIGLEWLFRLILGPKYRIKRIFKAIIIFPIKVIINN